MNRFFNWLCCTKKKNQILAAKREKDPKKKLHNTYSASQQLHMSALQNQMEEVNNPTIMNVHDVKFNRVKQTGSISVSKNKFDFNKTEDNEN